MGTIWYQVYLYASTSKKIGEFGYARAANFNFQKIPVILKINVLFYFICNRLPFASKKNRLKENLKLNNGRIVVIPQIGQNCFCLHYFMCAFTVVVYYGRVIFEVKNWTLVMLSHIVKGP